MVHSIRGRSILILIAMAIGPLLTAGIILAWLYHASLQSQELSFQQETAETALLDLEGLDALYLLLKGELRDYPVFFISYLRTRRFVVEGSSDGLLEHVAEVRDAAPTMTAPPRALAAPETIHFSVTGRCDQACAGCFYSARPGSTVTPSDAPFELFERVFE